MITHVVSMSGYLEEGEENEWTPEALEVLVNAAKERLKEMPQTEFPIKHIFANGLYYREMLIPKGGMLVGMIHKEDDLKIVYYGDIELIDTNGYRRVTGPCAFEGKAGTQPWALALEETLWASVHRTDLTDLGEIEKALFVDEPSEFDFATGKVKEKTLCQAQ